MVPQIDTDLVQGQLERILASPHFADTTRLKSFLRYVVNESLAGNSERLKAYAIAVDVFERGADFDPQTDTIVRVQAGKLRQRLDLYYAKEGRQDGVRIHVRKGSYAPVFEIADGVDRVSETAPGLTPEPTDRPEGPAIAVLPLDNLDPEPDRDYFADGITEEIINALTRFRELRVISRNSTFRYKGQHPDPRTLGKALGVDYVLEGSVRKRGQTVRVTAQLIETRNGTHLYSENHDRALTPENLFEIEDEIASHVAAEIADPHGILSRAGGRRARVADTSNMNAYESVLASYAYLRRPSEELHASMRERLEGAVALDPDYSSAWAVLAMLYVDELRGHYNLRPDPPPLDRALEAARRAARLDPLNAAAYWALALVRFHRKELNRFREAADKALRLNPNHPDHLADCGIWLALLGEWERGLALIHKAAGLCVDPPGWYFLPLAINLYRLGRYDEALVEAQKGIANAFHWGPLVELMILGQLDRREEAASLVTLVNDQMPGFPTAARDECRFWNLAEDAIEHFVDGWRKAGLPIAD